MAFNVFHNPKNVTINSTAITGVTAIAVNTQMREIHASADDDVHESLARFTTSSTSGSIELLDPVQAAAVSGTTGTLSFTWTDVKGSSDQSVSIAGCSLGAWRATVKRDSASQATIEFVAESAVAIS